jgi:hypothetical protein
MTGLISIDGHSSFVSLVTRIVGLLVLCNTLEISLSAALSRVRVSWPSASRRGSRTTLSWLVIVGRGRVRDLLCWRVVRFESATMRLGGRGVLSVLGC